jgi:hypothetical protein
MIGPGAKTGKGTSAATSSIGNFAGTRADAASNSMPGGRAEVEALVRQRHVEGDLSDFPEPPAFIDGSERHAVLGVDGDLAPRKTEHDCLTSANGVSSGDLDFRMERHPSVTHQHVQRIVRRPRRVAQRVRRGTVLLVPEPPPVHVSDEQALGP